MKIYHWIGTGIAAIGLLLFFSTHLDLYLKTGFWFPVVLEEYRYHQTDENWFGDGDFETTFKVRETTTEQLLEAQPFDTDWQAGPFIAPFSAEEQNVHTLSIFPESHKIPNNETIWYAVKDVSPDDRIMTNFYLIAIDPATNTVLFYEYHS